MYTLSESSDFFQFSFSFSLCTVFNVYLDYSTDYSGPPIHFHFLLCTRSLFGTPGSVWVTHWDTSAHCPAWPLWLKSPFCVLSHRRTRLAQESPSP